MKTIDHLLSEELISALGWTLIHALWQGAFFAILLAVILVLVHRYSSQARYFIATIALALFAASTIVSFNLMYNPSEIALEQEIITIDEGSLDARSLAEQNEMAAANPSQAKEELLTSTQSDLIQQAQVYFNQHLPLIVTLWMLGVVVLLLRFLGGLAYIQRLKSYRTELLPSAWLEKGEQLKKQLQLSKKVAFLASHKVLTPLAIGIFRPAILLPARLLTGLNDQQIEAILLHELAHIKRNDYLVNVLQTLIDILFFYHPAIWWISATIRNERENCCDDMVINITGETGNYARTLILLKEQEINSKLPAMAFTGIKYKFNNRIKRLFNQPPVFADFREGFVTALILVMGLFTIGVNAFGTPTFLDREGPLTTEAITEIAEPPAESQTTNTVLLERDQAEETKEENTSISTPQKEREEMASPEIERQFDPVENSELDLLLDAIDDGNIELVQFMLDKGADVNGMTKEGWTPLMEAADEGHMDILNLLLTKGAKVNAATKEGYTALMVAVDEGHSEIAQALIQQGAKLDATTEQGWDVFMEAIDEGQTEIVSMLIKKGAKVNTIYGHHTPLMEAIDEGHMEVVKLLLQNGADPNQPNDEGYTPLMEAADAGQPEIAKLLLEKGADVNATDGEGWNAFMEAIDEGQMGMVKLFLDKGAKVNEMYGHHTPLMEAIDEGHTEIVKLLIAKGADVNAQSKDGYTALMEAADEGQLEITRLLLDKGAKINPAGDNSWSAFFEAIDEGHMDLVKLYLEKGAKVNIIDKHGRSPLMEAADEGHIEMIRLLISKGADVNLQTKEGHSALTEATDEGFLEIVKLLVDKGAKVDGASASGWTPLMEAADEGHFEIMQYLVSRGANVNARREGGHTVLMEAVDEGHTDIARFLIQKGADVNAKTNIEWTHFDSGKMITRIESGWTALFEAVHEEHADLVQLLLDNGAKIDDGIEWISYDVKADKRIKHEGWTPLMEAVDNGHLPIAKLLVQQKADVNARTKAGLSALDIAKENDDQEMIKFIASRSAK